MSDTLTSPGGAVPRRCSDPSLDGGFVDELGQTPENGRVCFGWHTVPKVEYMTRPPSGTRENSAGLGLDSLPRAEQEGRIEVPLHAPVLTGLRPATVERNAPVEPDHVAARLGHRRQERCRPGTEMDRRHVD